MKVRLFGKGYGVTSETETIPTLPGVGHSRVDVGAFEMHVAEAGDPAAPPVLLLHGWPQNWWVWRRVIGPLAEDHRVIAPDLRGFGWSEAPPGGYDKETMAGDVVALLDALEIERTYLAGHDWGGWIGFLICLNEPERIRSYMAMGTGHPFPGNNPRVLLDAWRLWYQVVVGAPLVGRITQMAAARALPALGIRPGAWDDTDAEIFFGPLRRQEWAAAAERVYRSFLTEDLPAALLGRYDERRLTVPTLFLQGENDPVGKPPALEGLEEHADDARLEWLPDVGHWVPEEVPDLVAERARTHFTDNPNVSAI